MKRLFRIVSIFVLALYCLGIGSIYNHSNPLKNNIQDTKTDVSSASLNLLGNSSGAENLIISFNNTSSVYIKLLFRNYIVKIKTTQQLFAKEFTQYSSFVTNFQILFRKTNLIFPFNYFW